MFEKVAVRNEYISFIVLQLFNRCNYLSAREWGGEGILIWRATTWSAHDPYLDEVPLPSGHMVTPCIMSAGCPSVKQKKLSVCCQHCQ